MTNHDLAAEDDRVTRDEFTLLCEVIEIMMTIPGGLADQSYGLTWQARATLEEWAKMRGLRG